MDKELKSALLNIDNTQFSEADDVADIVEALDSLTARWKEVGAKLHLKPHRLNEMERNNPKNVKNCLTEVVVEWLQQNYDTERFGKPSWRRLAESVWKLNRDLFWKIAKEHKTGEASKPAAGYSSKNAGEPKPSKGSKGSKVRGNKDQGRGVAKKKEEDDRHTAEIKDKIRREEHMMVEAGDKDTKRHTKARLELNHSIQGTHGRYPSIAMNNGGCVVEVIQHSEGMIGYPSSLLSYRVGRYCSTERNDGITWKPERQAGEDGPIRVQYGRGFYPRVAVNDKGTVIAVHQNDNQCLYCVGSIADDQSTIIWNKQEEPQGNIVMAMASPIVDLTHEANQAGENFPERKISLPSVALKSDNDEAIVTFENGNGNIFYSVGTPEYLNGKVSSMKWSKPAPVPELGRAATEFCIAINSESTVVAAYRRVLRFQLYFVVGTLDGNKLTWTHRGGAPFDYGYSPVLSINSDGYFIIGHQSWIMRKTKFWIGNTNNRNPQPTGANERRNVVYGCYPSIAVNDTQDVVEVHETNFTPASYGNALYYRTGTLTTH